ncbi:MAG: DUF6596 domain-containing protein [Gemmatimonadaceae bacterium]
MLSVVFLIFNEGYTATSGENWMQAALCDESLRLGRMVVQLLPGESGKCAASLRRAMRWSSVCQTHRGPHGGLPPVRSRDRARGDDGYCPPP